MNDTLAIDRPERRAAEADARHGLSVVSIAKSYDSKAVLTDVSLGVDRGEVLGLLGPNGAGKTTCFYSIMGLVKPDSGRILLDGDDITGLPMYRRAILGLGYLPQETSIFRGLTVAQNIMAVLEVAEPDKQGARASGSSNCSPNSISSRLRDAPAMALSGGERRRCEIARALAANPSIMLLDEPFAGIDPISIPDIRDLIIDLKKRDIGVLITDHNVRETLDIVDRACIIYGGQVLFAGSPEDARRRRECPPPLSGRKLRALRCSRFALLVIPRSGIHCLTRCGEERTPARGGDGQHGLGPRLDLGSPNRW